MSEVKNLAYQDYLNGMKYQDIADKYNMKLSTIKSWASRYWKKGCNQEKKVATKKEKKLQPKISIEKEKAVVENEVKSVIKNADLTDKQRLFCIYYIRSFNATKAYQKAYECDYFSAKAHGFELLQSVAIKQQIVKLKQEKLNREFLTTDDIFQKYMDIAFADMTDFAEFGNKEIENIDADGQVRKIRTNYVNIKNSNEVDGTLISEISTGKAGVKIKLIDRMKALEWISEHMDMATEEQKARISVLKSKLQDGNNNTAVDDWISAVIGEEVTSDE